MILTHIRIKGEYVGDNPDLPESRGEKARREKTLTRVLRDLMAYHITRGLVFIVFLFHLDKPISKKSEL